MPFGLCNAPATFQQLMQVVLAGLEWKCCFVYLDDILVCSKTFEEHMEHLRLVFVKLRLAGLTLKPKKCCFLREEVQYLGHVISKRGILPDPEKTQKVHEFPTPTDVTRVRQFLGLASYYRRFVPGFARIPNSLHYLTKKDVPFEWTEECQAAFERLKGLLTAAPILAYPRFGPGVEFVLETDACLKGLGAVLGQTQEDGYVHPIAYASRSLQPHERNYGITELETLGVVWASKHFRPYLLGHHCLVLTDHSACTSLLNASRPSAKLARWAMMIQELDLEIRHRPGRTNLNADALSRNPECDRAPHVHGAAVLSVDGLRTDGHFEAPGVTTVDELLQQQFQEISESQHKSPELSPMIEYLEKGTLPEDEKISKNLVLEHSQYELLDGVLYNENPAAPGSWRIVVPGALRAGLMQEAHGGRFAGHF